MSEKPSVIVKRSKIQEVFDYCLDNKLEFSVKERLVGIDEYEISVDIADVRKAILFGMFLRENRMELSGMPQPDKSVAKKHSVTRKQPETLSPPAVTQSIQPAAPPAEVAAVITETSRAEENLPLSFDLN